MLGDRGRAWATAARLHDIPAFGAPVELWWRQRRYRCHEPACPVGGFSEDHPLAGPRGKLSTRAAWWAISCIQRDTASVAAVARRLGVDWHTVWDAITPLLRELADDPDRLDGVDTLGVDEHIWHHQPRPGKGPKELTGIVDLTRRNGRPKARLLDVVPGRSGKAYADWLRARGEQFTTVEWAWRRWTRSAATPTQSGTNSKTPLRCWMPRQSPETVETSVSGILIL
jgi:transposase